MTGLKLTKSIEAWRRGDMRTGIAAISWIGRDRGDSARARQSCWRWMPRIDATRLESADRPSTFTVICQPWHFRHPRPLAVTMGGRPEFVNDVVCVAICRDPPAAAL
jgi:hypothetical protein